MSIVTDTLVETIKEKGFRVDAQNKKAREGGQDRVTLTIAWD